MSAISYRSGFIGSIVSVIPSGIIILSYDGNSLAVLGFGSKIIGAVIYAVSVSTGIWIILRTADFLKDRRLNKTHYIQG